MADALDDELAAWLAQAAVDRAVQERLRERVLKQLAVEEATLLGLCLDLAEAARPVLLRTSFGSTHRCTIVAVGADFVAVRAQGCAVFVPVASLGAVRSAPGAGPLRRVAPSNRKPPIVARFADVLSGLAPNRPRVRLGVDGEQELLFGRLRGCGVDVLSVELGDDEPLQSWLPLRAVQELHLLDER